MAEQHAVEFFTGLFTDSFINLITRLLYASSDISKQFLKHSTELRMSHPMCGAMSNTKRHNKATSRYLYDSE